MKFNLLIWLCLAAAGPSFGAPLAIDPAQSSVQIAVKSTIDSFVAKLTEFDAAVTAGLPDGAIQTAVFRFNFSSIRTGNTDRDRDMNQWQQTSRFPYVTFTLASLDASAPGKGIAHGQLVFHGVERGVEFPLSITMHNQTMTLEGEVTVDTRDYGLPVIRKFLILKVDPRVRLHFHLQGNLANP